MRLGKIVCMVALVAISATIAKAGSIGEDPKLLVNKPGGGGVPPPLFSKHPNGLLPCPVGDSCFTNAATHAITPIMIPFSLLDSGMETLFYQGIGTINSPANGNPPRLWIEITGIPPTDQFSAIFNCSSNAFSSLGLGVCGGSNTVATSSTIEFSMFGGTLTPGTIYDVTLTSTPEPSTVLLFLSLIPAIGFGMKRWNARQTA